MISVFRSQKLENVSIALKFLEAEGVHLVNIDSTGNTACFFLPKSIVHLTNLKSSYRGQKHLKIFVWLYHLINKVIKYDFQKF